jgi:hypothetical protein
MTEQPTQTGTTTPPPWTLPVACRREDWMLRPASAEDDDAAVDPEAEPGERRDPDEGE